MSSWSSTLPELTGITTAAMDPARIEAAVRDGYATGHAAGYEDGRAAGFADGQIAATAALDDDRRRMASLLASLEEQIAELTEVEASLRRSFEAATASTAIDIASAILDREVEAAADPGADAIARAMAATPSRPTVATVRLHPHDASRLGDVPGIDLTVVPDPSVSPGGCLLQVEHAMIDATIPTALRRVREVLA